MAYRRLTVLTLALFLALGSAACGALSVGREFPSPARDAIKRGATAKGDLERMFGKPAEVGIEDGDETWTWIYFKKGNPDLSKNLKVRFAADGKVGSYSFSSNFPDDMKTMR
jgi:hypothetical protein